MSFTSAQFDADMFAMANKTEYKLNDNYEVDTSERLEINANNRAVLLHQPVAGSMYIAGMEETAETTVTTGKYRIVDNSGTVEIWFSPDDDLDFVDAVYKYVKEGVQEAIITNKEAAIGECSCIWPVYGNGDDCTESDIIGYYIVKVFRARITTVPGINECLVPLHSNVYEINFPNTEKLSA